MDLADLRMFEAVSRLGSMKRAAEALNTVQSNVTARVRALEDDLGVSLFQRHARGVTLTPAGQRMLPFATRATKLVEDARAAATDDGVPTGPLHIGSLETTTALRLAPVLSHYAASYPDVALVVSTGTTAELVTKVLNYEIDGACVAGPVDHPSLETQVIFTEEIVLVTPPSIKFPKELTAKGALRAIVFRYGCSYRRRLESMLSDMGIANAKPLELGSLDAIIACVAAGVGVTLLPRGVVARAEQEGQVAIHRLSQDQAYVETLFIRRKDVYASSALKALLAMAMAHARQETALDRDHDTRRRLA